MKNIILNEAWQEFYDSLPLYCSRDLIAQKSQVIERGTLANLDSLGTGIPNGRKIGKKICYPKFDTMLWLLEYCGEQIKVKEGGDYE